MLPTFQCGLKIVSATAVPPRRDGDPRLNVYHAELEDNASVKVSIAHPVRDPTVDVLQPRGARVKVFGDFKIVRTTFFVTATSLVLVNDDEQLATPAVDPAIDPALLALDEHAVAHWPILVFDGVVIAQDTSPRAAAILAVICLNPHGTWPRERVYMDCIFDCTTPHLTNMASLLESNDYVVVSGVLTGVVDDRFTFEVHDVRFDQDHVPCTAQGVLRENSLLRSFGGDACVWLSEVIDAEIERRPTEADPGAA
ncbi:hypothetical protein AURDEDRAFT_165572 [Auricularia subglabra TFB-10046 SS5]|nr:hypothetical protein AURDEDRAFT_165572 [Auricularia subglabra TFB-10046 SS5]